MDKQLLNNLDYKRRELEGTMGSFAKGTMSSFAKGSMGSFEIEGFDGVRKNNARKIFGILLIIIVVDFAMELVI